MSHSAVIELLCRLIRRPSVTPDDQGCQEMIVQRLAPLGFESEFICANGVTNVWLRRGSEEPLLVLAGHTDVVPAGERKQWNTEPFEPVIKEGMLYGRGAADMKGGLAAMVIAVEEFVVQNPQHKGSIAFLITSDEEGPALYGTKKVVETLMSRNEIPKWCMIGEPSSSSYAGDTIKHGRRGTLTGCLTLYGTQGHVAYLPADNPIHHAMAPLHEIICQIWDKGNDDFPATSLQFTDIKSGEGVSNIIPAVLKARFNLRFSTELTAEKIQHRIHDILKKHAIKYDLDWVLGGDPFLTRPGVLRDTVTSAIKSVTGKAPVESTAGGTSDGRFIAKMGTEVIELGVCNRTIHQVNECVAMTDLESLVAMYKKTLMMLLSG